MRDQRWLQSSTFLVLGVLLASCSSSKSEQETNDRIVVAKPEAIREPVPVGQCRIVATVIAVDGPRGEARQDDPCSRFPCAASVRVDSVLGYGSGFQGALGAGQTIEVEFLYTLAPSREAYPGGPVSLPGLGAGDQFQADLSGSQETLDRNPRRFSVALYIVRQKESQTP